MTNSTDNVKAINNHKVNILALYPIMITSPPIGGGRGIVMPMSVCVFVRVFAKFQSVISQPFLNRSS